MNKKKKKKACENSCFSSLFAAEDVSRGITSATRRQKFDQGKRKIEQIWMWNNPPGRRKKGRGKGEREKRERGEKGREPLPSFPNPPLFSLPPYPLPLPTPPTQATCRTPDCRIYYVNIDFLSLRRRRSSARNVPSGEERVRKLLRHCGENWSFYRRNCVVDQSRGADRVWRLSVDHRKFTRIDVDEFFSVE